MTVRLKSGEVVAWSPVDDGPVQQDVPEDGGSISAQLSLSTPGSMVTEAMTMTYDPAEPRNQHGEWFHGTSAVLHPGDLITSGHPATSRDYRLENVDGLSGRYTHITSDPQVATRYAQRAAMVARNRIGRLKDLRDENASEHVYKVEPAGLVEPDPDGRPGTDYRSKHPLRVVREVTPAYDLASISSQLDLAGRPSSGDTTYESTEATLSQIRTQLDQAVSGDAVAAITGLADTLPAALPDDPETVGHVADGQTALAGAMAALQRAVDAAQAALRSHEANNGPAHEAAQSAGGAPEREYVTDGLAGQIELAFNPAEPRGKGGEWVTLFHGTVESNIEGIREKGLNLAPGNIGIRAVAHTLTDTQEDASTYARNRAAGWLTPKVVEFHVPRKDAGKYLYPGDAYGMDAKAIGYALRKPLPSKYIHAVHDVPTGPTKLQFGQNHLLTTDLAAWEHEPRGKGGEWTYDTNIVGRVTATSPAGKTHTIYTRGLGLTKLRHPDDMPAPLYHGTRAQLKPGDQIEAGHPGNFVRSMDNVYLTEQPESSDSYKGARGYGQHVYEVRPTGWYGHRRDAKGAEWATGDPVTVVREVPNPRATIQS